MTTATTKINRTAAEASHAAREPGSGIDQGRAATQMTRKKIRCSAVRDMGWGLLAEVRLPGGGRLGVYQPRHARPQGKV